MPAITLYHAPGACSRVTLNALEEIGLDYEDQPLDLGKFQQRSPDYLAVNPMGRVPALKIGDRLLTENAAILHYLHQSNPGAELLPRESALPVNQALQDLVWCASTLHPILRQVRAPQRYTAVNLEAVRARGIELMTPILGVVADRLSNGRWWYDGSWSILDVYLYWIYATVAGAGLELSPWPALADHGARVRGRASFQRALAREQAAMTRTGMQLPPGMTL
ncbi:MAG TPA: glutathione S-transferase family protein [Alphaproteobacteria bacterium]|nr:glutathione S-transferase family protein [Alphaproteobacteria bacterium]